MEHRYGVAHSLIYTYARERLEPPEETRTRLSNYYMYLVKKAKDKHAPISEDPDDIEIGGLVGDERIHSTIVGLTGVLRRRRLRKKKNV